MLPFQGRRRRRRKPGNNQRRSGLRDRLPEFRQSAADDQREIFDDDRRDYHDEEILLASPSNRNVGGTGSFFGGNFGGKQLPPRPDQVNGFSKWLFLYMTQTQLA